jgi:hypothetical protein
MKCKIKKKNQIYKKNPKHIKKNKENQFSMNEIFKNN